MVFQDPLASLDPRMTLGASIAEPLLAFEPLLTRAQREEHVKAMMEENLARLKSVLEKGA